MGKRMAVLALPMALVIGACSENPVAPKRSTIPDEASLQRQVPSDGVGLVLNSLTGVTLPVVGRVSQLTVDQAAINEIVLGNVVSGVTGGVTRAVEGILGALNRAIGRL
jgi:hypothetical protein